MPSRTKLKNAAMAERSAALPKIPQELLDQFLRGPMTAEVRIPKSARNPDLHPAAQAPGRLRWCPLGWGSQIGGMSRSPEPDLQVAPALRTVFEVQVEDALQEPGPAQARPRAVRVMVCRDAGILCRPQERSLCDAEGKEIPISREFSLV